MDGTGGSLRTRSQAAPEWTLHETLTLVNEMNSTQVECGNKLSSFQKWQSTVRSCNSLGVNRSLNQCKKRWQFILEQYNQIKPYETNYRTKTTSFNENFDIELFNAINKYLGLHGGGGKCGADTDPDSDPEAQQVPDDHAFLDIGPKRQRKRTKQRRYKMGRYKMEERLNPWRRILNENRKYEQSKMGIKHEASIDGKLEAPRREKSNLQIKHETSNLEEKVELPNLSLEEKVELPSFSTISNVMAEQINVDNPEEMMAAILRENAELITAIIEGNPMAGRDCRLADFKNLEAGRVHLIRSQGNQLIDCLGKISDTLSQLCNAIHEK